MGCLGDKGRTRWPDGFLCPATRSTPRTLPDDGCRHRGVPREPAVEVRRRRRLARDHPRAGRVRPRGLRDGGAASTAAQARTWRRVIVVKPWSPHIDELHRRSRSPARRRSLTTTPVRLDVDLVEGACGCRLRISVDRRPARSRQAAAPPPLVPPRRNAGRERIAPNEASNRKPSHSCARASMAVRPAVSVQARTPPSSSAAATRTGEPAITGDRPR